MTTVFAHVFPEHGDEPDAANFAQVGGHDILSDYVVTGLDIENAVGGTFDLTAGVAFVSESSMDTQSPDIDPPETRTSVTRVLELPDNVTDIPYTEGDASNTVINNVFIGPDPDTKDGVLIEVKQGDDTANDGQVLIGEIEDGSSTFTRTHNRSPSVQSLGFGDFSLDYDDGSDKLTIDTTNIIGGEIAFRMKNANGTINDVFRLQGDDSSVFNTDVTFSDDRNIRFGDSEYFRLRYNSFSSKILFTRVNAGTLWEADQSGVNFPSGLRADGNDVLTTDDDDVVSSGVVTLSDSSAEVQTNITDPSAHFYVALDPTGDGANTGTEVSVTYRTKWYSDGSGSGYAIEILEEGTSVGNPDIGYKIIRR